MKTLIATLGATLLATSFTTNAANAPPVDPHGPLDPMPRSLEIRFALSALPPGLRDAATVYVLDPSKGYVRERTGTNGQTCFVSRTEWKFADYRNDIYDPTCIMYYAPNVAPSEVGGLGCPPCAPYPFLFEPGPHGYIIQRLGDTESDKIVSDEADLLRELCAYRRVLCLQTPQRP